MEQKKNPGIFWCNLDKGELEGSSTKTPFLEEVPKHLLADRRGCRISVEGILMDSRAEMQEGIMEASAEP